MPCYMVGWPSKDWVSQNALLNLLNTYLVITYGDIYR